MSGKKMLWIGVLAILAAFVMFRVHATASAAGKDSGMSTSAVEKVEELRPVSLYLVDQANNVLSQGWSGMSQAERETFLQIYDPAGTGEVDAQFVIEVSGHYEKIHTALAGEIEVVYAAESDKCDGQRLYFTDLSRLYVCPYFFEEENELRKARTLIHEITHIALLVTDRPYYRPTSKRYARLTPYGSWMTRVPLAGRVLREVLRGDTLYHPDAYAHYAVKSAGYTNIYAGK